jgi:hypothetical protein
MAQIHPTTHKPIEKVGAIIVHGIGEQRRFEFLEGETRKIVDAIIANYGKTRRKVTPTLTTGSGDAFLGPQANWASGGDAPLHTMVELDDKIIDIAFHEVWWADINETLTFGKQIRFWAWGLSLAGIATHNDQFLPDAENRTRLPNNADKLTWRNRVRISYTSVLFGFSAFSVALINLVLKQIGSSPLPLTATIVNYLSAVKLYSQNKRAGGSPMDGPDEPPRVAIRRRMIRVMIDMARARYNRWYILAHSLGTVVAWNGLMEIQQALPNYLSHECWDELMNPLRQTSDPAFNVNAMMPNRPVWLGRHEIVDRDALFSTFRGILTYGSPLERFCALWSAMVPINLNEGVFQKGAEWINVYDPTDPVGTWLCDFDPLPAPPADTERTKLKPYNFPCRSSAFLLYSHLCYLNAPRRATPDSENFLVNRVARWLVEGESLASKLIDAPKTANSFWMPRGDTEAETHRQVWGRVAWRFIQAGLVGLALTLATMASLHYAIFPLVGKIVVPVLNRLGLSGLVTLGSAVSGWASSCIGATSGLLSDLYIPTKCADFLSNFIWLWVVTIGVVAIASVINYFVFSKPDREQLREHINDQRAMPES